MLEDKVILLNGSSRGMGAAAARLAKGYGAKVIVHGRTDSPELQALAKALDAPYVVADITDKSAVEAAVAKALTYYGRIDGLINTAGMAAPKPFLEADDASWQALFQTNVLGTVHFCQAVIPYMQKQGGGRIVNVSSIRGDTTAASSRTIAYSASKAAVNNLTSALAKEYAPAIAINCVAPGFTQTDIAKSWNDAVRQQLATALVGRAAQPEEIAEVILFLVSDRASFVTGQVWVADGGYEIAGK